MGRRINRRQNAFVPIYDLREFVFGRVSCKLGPHAIAHSFGIGLGWRQSLKRLVFCFDGSWNRLDADCPTNVVLLAESVRPTAKDGTSQIVYYDEGVGTAKGDRLRGGMFGVGLKTNLREAYRFLIFNFEPDDEIFVFGFSRGAFTARSFAGFIRHVGILDINNASQIDKAIELYEAAMGRDGDDHPSALTFRATHSSKVCVSAFDEQWRCQYWPEYEAGSAKRLTIKYVGVWDTVGALGLPNVLPFAGWLNRRYGFHDIKLTSKVQSARHALAIDERRKLFRPTVWNNVADLNAAQDISPYNPEAPYQQKWFPGVHGAVGGGGPERGLSDAAFSWILVGARRAGLKVNISGTSRIFEVAPDPLSPLQNEPTRPWHDKGTVGAIKSFLLSADREGPLDLNDVSASARRRWYADADQLPEKQLYRPKTLSAVGNQIEAARFAPSDIELKSVREHLVVPGDDLAKIALTYLGDATRMNDVFEANRDLIDDPREIHPGWVVRIP